MFLFHFYHFHHRLYDTYCFESSDHKAIRKNFNRMIQIKKIEEELKKLGLQDNMIIQEICIIDWKRKSHMNLLCNF